MGRKKKEEVKPTQELAVIPVADSGLSVLDSKNIEEYQRDRYVQEVPALTDAVFLALKNKMADGDMRAIQLGAEILGMVKGNGFSVQTNIYNQNLNVNNPNSEENFASLVRKLDDARRLEKNETVDGSQIVDAEIIEE